MNKARVRIRGLFTSPFTAPPVTVPRPTEVYYNKLTPALKEIGVSSASENRKEWPILVLRKVLEDLVEETPSDLLSREMW